jgi:hypothetical protein
MSAASALFAVTWCAIFVIIAANKILDALARDVEDHEG